MCKYPGRIVRKQKTFSPLMRPRMKVQRRCKKSNHAFQYPLLSYKEVLVLKNVYQCPLSLLHRLRSHTWFGAACLSQNNSDALPQRGSLPFKPWSFNVFFLIILSKAQIWHSRNLMQEMCGSQFLKIYFCKLYTRLLGYYPVYTLSQKLCFPNICN